MSGDGPPELSFPGAEVDPLANPAVDRETELGNAAARLLPPGACEAAREEVSEWPGYEPTPLRELGGLARRAGIGALWYKDESGRFGLGSFKALGGPLGVREAVGSATGEPVTVTCASEGNHGRAVAWGAELFGCRCVVFLPEEVGEARSRAIAGHGARVARVEGGYDRAVREAARAARERGWSVVSDTGYAGYTEIPRRIMQGYTVLVQEVERQLPEGRPPTHAFVQAGVGGLAGATCARLWRSWGADRPRFAVVEARGAECFRRSMAAGEPASLEGPYDTRMGGLACGEPSSVAWPVLRDGADFFLGVPDSAAERTMRLLARPRRGDPGVVAGPSGAAGLAGLLAAATDPAARRLLELDEGSRVLVVGTEGAMEPEAYRRIVGRRLEQVRNG